MAEAVGIFFAVFIPVCAITILLLWLKWDKIKEWNRRRHDGLRTSIYQPSLPLSSTSSRSNEVFREEFRIISQTPIDYPCRTAIQPHNVGKNRYKDVIHGDMFIATQDPLPDQDEAFWLMVWQNEVSIIIRLSSDSVEFPVAQYTPDVTNETWDSILRRVVVLHLTSWKAGSTPLVNDVLQMVSSAQLAREKLKGMVLVHCGAGAGRTGTIIALWQIRDVVMRGLEPNIYEIVLNLRHERTGMVQTQEQYLFLYKCAKKYSQTPYKWMGTGRRKETDL
ncbi:Receptor-type tyrosine-protein phosphatase eta [Armadillidium vulgare]|nr:Receptor-type tyrosine-protein phosphatase eta [Armadillidium vulgare]